MAQFVARFHIEIVIDENPPPRSLDCFILGTRVEVSSHLMDRRM
jgi:hypothetical protein